MPRREYKKLLVLWSTVAFILGLFIMINANLDMTKGMDSRASPQGAFRLIEAMTEEKNGATGKLTIRQWKATKLEIQDDEAKRITKKILHDEYLKPYPFDVPKGLEQLVFEMEAMKANLPNGNISKPATTTQPTQIPAPPLQPTTSTKPTKLAIDDQIKTSDVVSFEYDSAGPKDENFDADFEDLDSVTL